MEHVHTFFTDKVKLGKKGQITIPKIIRDEDQLKERDTFIVTHTPGGDIVLRKQHVKTPEDRMLEAIKRMPKFDFEQAWKEVLEERRRSDR